MGEYKAQLIAEWMDQLGPEFEKPYMQELRSFLQAEKKAGKTIYPKSSDIFNALNSTPPSELKVVILGQDPYHGPGQAHGLCFSVQPGVACPPSLKNIYKELANDVGFVPPNHGFLERWTKQGVLLLNSILTVEASQAGSHQKHGWETFTDQVINAINKATKHTVFLLWGSYARKKGANIDRSRHLVLEAPHPSPLSAHRGFFGCSHFSKANEYLNANGKQPIDWQI